MTRRRVLVLQGGALHGLNSNAVIERVERLTGAGIMSQVDLCIGTSIGAILTGGYAVGLTGTEMGELIVDNAGRIFGGGRWRWLRTLWGLRRPRYDYKPFLEVLDSLGGKRPLSGLTSKAVFRVYHNDWQCLFDGGLAGSGILDAYAYARGLWPDDAIDLLVPHTVPKGFGGEVLYARGGDGLEGEEGTQDPTPVSTYIYGSSTMPTIHAPIGLGGLPCERAYGLVGWLRGGNIIWTILNADNAEESTTLTRLLRPQDRMVSTYPEEKIGGGDEAGDAGEIWRKAREYAEHDMEVVKMAMLLVEGQVEV